MNLHKNALGADVYVRLQMGAELRIAAILTTSRRGCGQNCSHLQFFTDRSAAPRLAAARWHSRWYFYLGFYGNEPNRRSLSRMNFANSGRFDHNSRRGGQNACYSQLGKGRQCSKGTIGSIAPDRNPIVRTYRAPTKPERIKRSQNRARECNPWPGQNRERARGPTSKWRTKR